MEKKKFVVPHVYILLLALILVFSLLSYVIPSNVYDYHDVVVNPETGQTRSVVDPETYHAVDPTPVSLMQFLTAVPRGMQESAQIIFFIFIEVKVGCIFITASSELFQNPSLTHLTYALHN